MLIEKCSLSHVIPLGVEETGKDGSGRFGWQCFDRVASGL